MHDLEDKKLLAGYTDGSEDGLTPSEQDALAAQQESSGKRRRLHSLLLTLTIILVTSVISGAAGAWWRGRSTDLDAVCSLHTTKYSPVNKEVTIRYETRTFNATSQEELAFRRPAGPDAEAPWEAIGVDYRPAFITVEEGLKSGLTMDHVQRADKYGGGFAVNIEAMHSIHCLNLIRKAQYYNYDYYKKLGLHEFSNKEPVMRLHIMHCFDTLRHALMCTADTGVIGQLWKDEGRHAFSDFNNKHTCANYEDVRAWAEANQFAAPESLPDDYMDRPNNS